ncbi:hypothetical protein CERZMDRAFT_53935, partial [Cercospora zeae-maydis SCOH1-5]
KSKTNNTGDSHVVTHRSTNPAITCLYMAERTGCLAFTYLWSFVPDPGVFQLIYLPRPPPQDRTVRGKAPLRPCPRSRGRPCRPPQACRIHPAKAGLTLSSSSLRGLRPSPCPSSRGRPCRPPRTCREPINPFVQYTRLQVRAHQISPSTNGEVFNKSSG